MTKKTMNMQRWAALAVAAMVCAGCATQPAKPLSILRELSLQRADAQPRKDWIEGRGVKVVVGSAQANQAVRSAIERSVGESGSEVIGRPLDSYLREDEPMRATASYSVGGSAAAHFAVTPLVSKWSVSSTKQERGSFSNSAKKNDRPVYMHAVAVEGRIRVEEIPSMRLIATLHFKEEQSEENASSELADREARLRKVFEKAYLRIRNDFKNLIAPRGAVVKKALSENGMVFQVMMGGQQRVVPLDTVKFYSGGGREMQIAEGTVTGEIAARSCWVIVDDPEAAGRIREGDVAQLVVKDYASILAKQTSW